MKITCATVNRTLKELGYKERLVKNHSGRYYYWIKGDSTKFFDTIIGGVFDINVMSMKEIINDLKRKKRAIK